MSSTPGQLEHVHDNATQRGADGAAGDFFLHHWMQILILLLALAGLLGNGAVLWLLGFRVQRTPFSVYILNLAAAEALFLCFTLLLCIREFYRYLSGGSASDLVLSLKKICYIAGLSLLAAISTERCLTALFPSGTEVNAQITRGPRCAPGSGLWLGYTRQQILSLILKSASSSAFCISSSSLCPVRVQPDPGAEGPELLPGPVGPPGSPCWSCSRCSCSCSSNCSQESCFSWLSSSTWIPSLFGSIPSWPV